MTSTLQIHVGRLLLACFIALTTTSALAQSTPPKKVTIALGGAHILNVAYAWLLLPVALGYWREEGYDVDILPTPGSLQAVQLLAAGTAQFAQVNSTVLIQAKVANNVPLSAVSMNGVLDWSVAVPVESEIRSAADLEGKTIGIASLASGGTLLLRAFIRAQGLDPDKDVNVIAVGVGAPALEALRQNRVHALMFWKTAFVGFENAGAKLRYMSDPEWAKFADFSLVTSQRVLDADAKMVETIARGVAKASLFTVTNPDCARRIMWKHFPITKPAGSDEITLARNDNQMVRAAADTMEKAFKLSGSTVWGKPSGPAYELMQNFMYDNKLVSRKIPSDDLLYQPAGFSARVGQFDSEAVMREARACAAG